MYSSCAALVHGSSGNHSSARHLAVAPTSAPHPISPKTPRRPGLPKPPLRLDSGIVRSDSMQPHQPSWQLGHGLRQAALLRVTHTPSGRLPAGCSTFSIVPRRRCSHDVQSRAMFFMSLPHCTELHNLRKPGFAITRLAALGREAAQPCRPPCSRLSAAVKICLSGPSPRAPYLFLNLVLSCFTYFRSMLAENLLVLLGSDLRNLHEPYQGLTPFP